MDNSPQHTITPAIGGDILRGAGEIAAFLYGNEMHRRKVYNLVETKRLPHFRLGSLVCARKSVLLAWVKAQEELSNTQVTA
jgi:excisionase family DNA binding protein